MNGMKRTGTIFCLASLALLASCSGSDDSLTGSPVYTVTYLDDLGAAVGYSYVPRGMAASFKNNDGTTYDYLPRGKKRDEGVNASAYVFDGWEGAYANLSSAESSIRDGEAVDLLHIYADCSVSATFKRIDYSFGLSYRSDGYTLYKNGDATIRYGEDGSAADAALSYESVSSSLSIEDGKISFSYPFDSNPSLDEDRYEYFRDPSFGGWDVLGSSVPFSFDASNEHSFAVKTQEWTYGETPAFEASSFAETILLNLAANANGQYDYPAFYSDGESWVSLGRMSQTPSIILNAHYDLPYRSFSIYLFDSEAAALSAYKSGQSLTPAGHCPYGATVEIVSDASNDKAVFHYEDGGVTKDDTYVLPIYNKGNWTGFCGGFSNFDGLSKPSLDADGKAYLDMKHGIAGDVYLYPKV